VIAGIPYSYWSQYIEIYGTFWEIGAISVAAGFGVSFLFLAVKLMIERRHTTRKVLVGSLIGASLIAITCILSLVCVSGLSALFDVSFTGFSIMSFVLSVGFAVEYSVHIVAHWLLASASFKTSLERVEHAMEFLFLPTFMSFVSSTIGVACLAFTE
jgi:predicted RND superfamily exporter protein